MQRFLMNHGIILHILCHHVCVDLIQVFNVSSLVQVSSVLYMMFVHRVGLSEFNLLSKIFNTSTIFYKRIIKPIECGSMTHKGFKTSNVSLIKFDITQFYFRSYIIQISILYYRPLS